MIEEDHITSFIKDDWVDKRENRLKEQKEAESFMHAFKMAGHTANETMIEKCVARPSM